MSQHNFFVIAMTWLFTGTIVLVVLGQPYTAYYPYCSNTDNYTMASEYQVNLVSLMSDLPQGAINNRGFYTSMAGEAPDRVYGLTMCYVDRNWTQCQDCVRAAAAGVQQTCPFSREMEACYDACILRYSNVPFFSVADPTTAVYMFLRSSVVSDAPSMVAARQTLMSQLAAGAAAAESSPQLLGLANGSVGYTDSLGAQQVIYGLTQCTRDLNASECTRCLTETVNDLSSTFPNDTYGAVKAYSCYVVYSVGGDFLTITLPP
ncbi:hypothetical protein HU200_067836 [Digitaria exilis]|uniref:Gnk2-homologous domain-containing protein n=1 Tax=Digitaria exilis TaxID=1010633 RepID=A0A834ZZQ7_9POAL|nr:hypothetical protein HU200_067836 [Digitaria exilis]